MNYNKLLSKHTFPKTDDFYTSEELAVRMETFETKSAFANHRIVCTDVIPNRVAPTSRFHFDS